MHHYQYQDFWDLTLREIDIILTARSDQTRNELTVARSVNYELAALIRVAFHAPDKFPDYKKHIGSDDVAPENKDRELFNYLLALSKRTG